MEKYAPGATHPAEGAKQEHPSSALAFTERDFRVYDSRKKVTVDVIERHSGGARLVATGVTQDDAAYIVLLAKAVPKLFVALKAIVDSEEDTLRNGPDGVADLTQWYLDHAQEWNRLLANAEAALREARGEAVS